MAKKLNQKQLIHKSDQSNANKGTNGVNKTYSQVHGNRGKQMNPNQKTKN
jgi:hypothetical protein